MVIAVRTFSPSFPAGSLVAPQRNWMRNAMRGEEGLGRRLVLRGEPAAGCEMGFIVFCSFESAVAAGRTPRSTARAKASGTRRGLIGPPRPRPYRPERPRP